MRALCPLEIHHHRTRAQRARMGDLQMRVLSKDATDSGQVNDQEKKVPCEVYSRIVGYLRPVQNWNKGKAREFAERKPYRAAGRVVGEGA